MNHTYPGSSRPFEDMKRTSRILELIQVIALHPQRCLRRDLAQRFEVSERMIQKDLEVIRHGLKLDLQHSTQGYYFETMPRLPAVQISFQEALALLQAVQAAQQTSGIVSSELSAALARLEALFPPEFVPLLHQLHRPPVVTAQRRHRQQMLDLLNRALAGTNKVQMQYETRSRGGDCTERTIHPYHLMPYVRSWQLVAFCELRQQVLIFKVDRIHQARLLEDRYPFPQDFDLEEYLGDGWGLMRGQSGSPEAIVLRFQEQAGRRVAEEYWHASQQSDPQPDGALLFRLHITPTPEFISWLLYYGDQVTVEQPVWLREKVREAHLRAAERNENIIEEENDA